MSEVVSFLLFGGLPELHRHNLCDHPEEGLLESHSDTDQDLRRDESVDAISSRANDAANQCKSRSEDEEPDDCQRIL